MSSGLTSLYKILKDETRKKTVILLNEKSAMSYTELMEALGIVSTGTLNYHLKVLGDLLFKNENGQYALTEKGKLASKLLQEFPEDYQAQKRKWQRRFFIALGIGQAVYFSITLTLHYLGYLDFYRVLTATSWSIIGTIALYFSYRMQRTMPESGSKEMKSRMRKVYTAGGAWLAAVLVFIGGGLLFRLLQDLSGTQLLHNVFWSSGFLALALIVAPIIGGFVGYRFGKRKGFQKPKWAVWLDERLG
jgi:DNA-binding transcriptional ArsR family regulator